MAENPVPEATTGANDKKRRRLEEIVGELHRKLDLPVPAAPPVPTPSPSPRPPVARELFPSAVSSCGGCRALCYDLIQERARHRQAREMNGTHKRIEEQLRADLATERQEGGEAELDRDHWRDNAGYWKQLSYVWRRRAENERQQRGDLQERFDRVKRLYEQRLEKEEGPGSGADEESASAPLEVGEDD